MYLLLSLENVQETWPTKMDFGWPNTEIGWKMANGRLLFLALVSIACFTKRAWRYVGTLGGSNILWKPQEFLQA